MKNDTPISHAFDLYGRWIGIGTRKAIEKRGLHSDGIVYWCPHQWLVAVVVNYRYSIGKDLVRTAQSRMCQRRMLNIASRRHGFGRDGVWLWSLRAQLFATVTASPDPCMEHGT